MPSTQVRDNWAEVIDEARHGERISIERAGVQVAGLVSPQDLAWLTKRDKTRTQLRKLINQMSSAFQDVSKAELEAEISRSISEVRGGVGNTSS